MTASKISRRHAIKISRRQQRKKWGFAFICYKTRFCFRCFRDATVRSVSCAMAGAALPGAQTVRGQLLTDYKANIRKHLEVQATLASSRCIACTGSEGTTCFYSQAGRTEYDRAGVCESCWDCMFDPAHGRQQSCWDCMFDPIFPMGGRDEMRRDELG